VPLQIVCVEREGKDRRHRHVSMVGVVAGNTIIRFSVTTVRKLIKKGTVSFICLDANGRKVPVRRYRCDCGTKSIRTASNDQDDTTLSRLPTCGR
jgi:hypothetical protein